MIVGNNGPINRSGRTELFLGNAGTAMRPMTGKPRTRYHKCKREYQFALWIGVLCAGNGEFVLDGTPRMRERPIIDLVDGLKQLGVDIQCSDTGCPPVVINAKGITGTDIKTFK